MLSGQCHTEALSKEAPEGYAKVCEGSTAVLFPPAFLKGNRPASSSGHSTMDTEETNSTSYSAANISAGNSAVTKERNKGEGEDAQSVFYNPAQVVNRDLSVCALEVFSRLRRTEPRRKGGTTSGITILEALSATGLRAIRYFKEVTNVRYIIANDLDSDAVKCIRLNCAFNNVPVSCPTLEANLDPTTLLESTEKNEVATEIPDCQQNTISPSCRNTSTTIEHPHPLPDDGSSSTDNVPVYGAVIPNVDDAIDLMHRLALSSGAHKKRFALVGSLAPNSSASEAVIEPVLQQELMDVVDLDPYGSASPFLDGAMRCVKEGGMMLVTSTDSAVLCGNHMDTCHAKYNSLPHKGSHCHDMAVRILLCCIERVANKHRKYIVPLISLHLDFYVRCIFRVYTQPAEAKNSVCKFGYQVQCTNCPAFWVRPMALERASRQKKSGKRERGKDPVVHSGAEAGKTFSHSNVEMDTSSVDMSGSISVERFPPSPCLRINPRLVCPTLSSLQCPSVLPASSENLNTSPLESSCGEKKSADNEKESESRMIKNNSACPVCGRPVVLSGPLYASPTQNKEFLAQLLSVIEEKAKKGHLTATARMQGLVQTALEELPDCPLYYNLPDIASYVRVRCPSTPCFVGALGRMGYRCSQVHCEPSGIKTDCPPAILFAVMLQWKVLQEKSSQDEKADENTSSLHMVVSEETKGNSKGHSSSSPLLVSPLVNSDFSYDKKYDFRRDSTGIAKFVPNAPGWGPKRRHTGIAAGTTDP